MKRWLYLGLVALFLLHNDLWLWSNAHLIAGIPSGLVYHIAFCIVATFLMIALTRYAWPEDLEVNSEESSTV